MRFLRGAQLGMMALLGCAPASGVIPVSPETSTTTPEDTVVLTQLGTVICANPDARITTPYVRYDDGEWGQQAWTDSRDSLLLGGGVAVADFDGDGGLDIFLPNAGAAQLFLSRGQLDFRDASSSLPEDLDGAVGATAADVDDDGDLDLIVLRMLRPNALLINDGNALFTRKPLGDLAYRSVGAAFADGDQDGDLDVIVANYGVPMVRFTDDPNVRYENDGFGNFVPVDLAIGLEAGHSLGLLWQDLNGDSRPDLYVANDFGWMRANQLGTEQLGQLVLDPIKGVNLATNAMGIAVGEINGDGLPDLMVTGWGELGLLTSLDVATGWAEASTVSNLVPPERSEVAWAAEFGDLDNDGDEDLYVSFGWLDSSLDGTTPAALDQSDAVYLQGPNGGFTEVAPAWGLDGVGISRGMMLVDLDGNGFLDVIKRDKSGPAQIWLGQCDGAAWLSISLHQSGPNPFAIGAEIRAVSGERTRTRWVRAGGTSHASSGPPEVHIGLGENDSVDALEITWPDGEITVLTSITTRQRLRIERLP